MKFSTAAVLAAMLFIAACSKEPAAVAPAAEPQARAADPAETLRVLFDEFFERGLEMNPVRASAIERRISSLALAQSKPMPRWEVSIASAMRKPNRQR